MQVSSTSPYILSHVAQSSSVVRNTQSQSTEAVTTASGETEERNYGSFYESWHPEAKEAYNALVDQNSETFADRLITERRASIMELVYSMRLAAKGKTMGPENHDELMAEAFRIRDSKDYPSLSTKEGFNTMMKEVIASADLPGGNQDTITFYKTLFSMANSGYASLDLEA